MEISVMGSHTVIESRPLFARNMLNLNTWYGFQAIRSVNSFSPKTINFDFLLESNAYLLFSLGPAAEEQLTFRISKRSDIDSAILRADLNGQYHLLKKLSLPILANDWYHFTLEKESDSYWKILINNKIVDRFLYSNKYENIPIEFRSGNYPASVDNIIVINQDGSVFFENFESHKNFILFFLWNLFLISLLICGIVLIGFLLKRKTFLLAILYLALLICIGSIYYFFDYYYASQLYISRYGVILRIEKPEYLAFFYEKSRYSFFKYWSNLIENKKIDKNPKLPFYYPAYLTNEGPFACYHSKCEKIHSESEWVSFLKKSQFSKLRVLFIGGSQTFGSGASNLNHTFFAQTYHLLEKQWARKNIQFLNISAQSAPPSKQYEIYKNKFYQYNPHIIVFNFGHNGENSDFIDGIKNFIQEVEQQKIIGIFILEPVSMESQFTEFITKKHNTILALLKKKPHYLFDLNGYLKQPQVHFSGPIWWDRVHLTDYGQYTVTNWLAPKLNTIIKKSFSETRKP